MRAVALRCWASQPMAGAMPPAVLERRMNSTSVMMPGPEGPTALRRSQGMAVWFGRGAFLEELASDDAAVFGLPDWSGFVDADIFARGVGEGGFRGLEDPLRAGDGLLTGVNLHAFASNCEDRVLGCWRVCGILGGCGGGDGERSRRGSGE